jgi:hypothetical protein
MYGKAEVKREADKTRLYFNSKPAGILDHWHFDTFKVSPEESSSPGPGSPLADSLVTFVLNARGKVARMEIADLDVFERVPEPEEKKD